nr:uncharacterized mitochondrial protein AtMg00810-like [Tanacetum cinerariifolium]
MEVSDQHHIMLPLWSSISFTYKTSDDKAKDDKPKNHTADSFRKEFELGYMYQRGATKTGSTNSFNTVSNPVNAASTLGTFSAGGPSSPHPDAFIPANTLLHVDQDDSQIPDLEDTAKLRSTGIFNSAYDDDLDICTSLMEPKKVTQALDDESWIEAMQEELLQFNLQKRIFRYLKGQPKLGLWYPRDSLFDMEAYSDSDYAGDNLDRKFTTG